MASDTDKLLRGLTKSQDARLKNVMQLVEHAPPGGPPTKTDTSAPTPKFWALLADEDASNLGRYKWKAQWFSDGAWTDVTPTISSGDDYTAYEANTTSGLKGQVVELQWNGYDSDNKPLYVFNSKIGIIVVYLTQTGGDDGDDASALFPTYTYDVYVDPAKTLKIATDATVLFHRLLQISVHKAAHGIASWDGTTCILVMVDEYYDDGDCA